MVTWNQYLTALILNFILLFVFCWDSILFSSKISAGKITSRSKKILVSLLGSAVISYLSVSATIEVFYLIIYFCFIFAYLFLLGKSDWKITFFLTNAYLINIMTGRMLITCVIALATQNTISEVAYSSFMLSELSIIVTLCLLIIALVIMIRIVPYESVYQITQITELRRGMNLFMGLSNLYLFMQSSEYGYADIFGFTIFRNLISICILLLIANWAFLIYNLKILRLLNIETKNIQMQTEMEKLNVAATTDGLTGISNKMTAIDSIEKELIHGGAFFIIDIDNFKAINDTLGHNTGDILLKNMSATLKSSFREKDIIGRFGGDEFLVFMQNQFITNAIVEKKAADLCLSCQQEFKSEDGIKIFSTVSIGVLMIPQGTDPRFDTAFQLADNALYESKEKGKNIYTIHTYEPK